MKKLTRFVVLTALILFLGITGGGYAEILPPYGEGQIGVQAVILPAELTLYEEPSRSSKAIKQLQYGDLLIVVKQFDDWAVCTLGDSEDALTGWVEMDYLAVDPAWYQAEEDTLVYAWGDTSAPKVALLGKDMRLAVLRTEGNWIVVSLHGAAGWIHSENKVVRQDGERFETSIMLEGMEETVHYEHIVNSSLGIEMDYNYEIFLRHSNANSERFVSLYDDPQHPLNFLEVTFIAQDAEAVAAAISESLSGTYEITREPCILRNAGNGTVIDASRMKGTDMMPDLLQSVYVIPEDNGCIVATMYCTFESAEGFGRQMNDMLNTLCFMDSRSR